MKLLTSSRKTHLNPILPLCLPMATSTFSLSQPRSKAEQSAISRPHEVEEPRRVEDEINPNITEDNPQCSIQDVDQSVHPSTSPRDEEEPRTEEHIELAIFAVDPRVSLSSVRDDNLEASRGASHEDSNPRNDITNLQIEQAEEVNTRASPCLAQDGNLEASRGANQDDTAQRTRAHEEISSPNPLQSSNLNSILSTIKEMAKDHHTQFNSLKKAIRRVRKSVEKMKKHDSHPPALSRKVEFEELMLKAQSDNEASFVSLRESLTNIQREQHAMKVNQFGLKERVDLSCVKMDLVGENIAISGTNDDANKGEKRPCKGQGRSDKDREDDNDRRDGDGNFGGGKIQRVLTREEFLALPPPLSSSTLRHEKSQGRGHKKKTTTLAADGKEVEYIPYEQGSGKKF
nr:myelin transcription factor 1-like protein [Ipomoea batatas]